MQTSLVVLAAGLGQRFGGIKQITPVGPNNEILIDYSVYDAKQAGFDQVVFIIKRNIEEAFKEAIGKRVQKMLPVSYAFQDEAYLPDFYQIPKDRVKMLGTVQAMLACKDAINGPFAIINADDYYGKDAFSTIHSYLVKNAGSEKKACMVGYQLKNTISRTGSVTRGICHAENGLLQSVTETYEIAYRESDGAICSFDADANGQLLDPESIVSMNFWGFFPEIFPQAKAHFDAFLASLAPNELKKEYPLPTMVDDMIKKQLLQVDLLTSKDTWFGMTNQQDRAIVQNELKHLHEIGAYPSVLK